MGEVARVKRLLFESQKLVLGALREQVTSSDPSQAKRIPDAEREERLKALRLTGLSIEGPLESSHALLQMCTHQRETGQLVYIPPERCVSRVHEVTCGKSPSKQLALESDKLVLKETHNIPDETATSELKVMEALKRRGLPYTFADALSFTAYDQYLTKLFSHLRKDPPKGFSRCSVSQLPEVSNGAGSFRTVCGHGARDSGAVNSFGVDRIKSSTLAPIHVVDLPTQQGRDLVLMWLHHPMVQGLHAAPPRETCSLASTLPVKRQGLRGRGPKPLRSRTQPEGLWNLREDGLASGPTSKSGLCILGTGYRHCAGTQLDDFNRTSQTQPLLENQVLEAPC